METTTLFQHPINDQVSSDENDLGKRILLELGKHEKGMTRSDLCLVFALPRTTIYDAIRQYLATGLVTKENRKPKARRRGRSDIYFILSKKK